MPNRDRILADIGESLSAINGGGGYWYALSAIGTTLRTYDELGASELPWVGYWPTESSPAPIPYPFGDELHTLEVQLMGVIAATLETRSRDLARLETDLRRALYADRTRGGWAIDTQVATAVATDEGNPDKQGINGARATLALTVRCLFFPDDP